MSKFDQIKQAIQKANRQEVEEIEQALDELVSDCKLKEASSINNQGIDSQISFLIQSMGKRDLMADMGVPLEDIQEILYGGTYAPRPWDQDSTPASPSTH